MPPKRKAAVASANAIKESIVADAAEEQALLAPPGKKSKGATATGASGKFGLQWSLIGDSLHVLDSAEIKPSAKVVGFDMDDTLVTPKSGAKFPKGRADWRWLFPEVVPKLKELNTQGYKVVVFTNQAGIEKKNVKASDIEGKILDLAAELGFPFQALIAAATDHNRKPHTTMWEHLEQHLNGGLPIDRKQSIFVGDAAGRHKAWKAGAGKDFSCSDRTFAHNVGLEFKTPEEFFLGHEPTAKWDWESIDPAAELAKLVAAGKSYANLHKPSQELVIFVGCPAAGKSTFARKHFVPHGYLHVNQDTLKTKEKCVKAASEALAAGQSVVVDNTNAAAETRGSYLALAKAKGIPARCFVFKTDVELAHHLNFFREKLSNGEIRRIPDVGYNMFKSKFEAPSAKEGFAEVTEIDFVPDFADESAKKLFLYRTC
eukprot:TRINITY_DN6162_c0_g1_i1.p2 TRINITY_DN6162_c0_g1~~TRINITY_DN6162_c0_g1_i1.p2  ORF type:complete len:430 (+),score=197.27 TRINITY_DN6162_c0_g1_i1:76-1365(+)